MLQTYYSKNTGQRCVLETISMLKISFIYDLREYTLRCFSYNWNCVVNLLCDILEKFSNNDEIVKSIPQCNPVTNVENLVALALSHNSDRLQ